MSYATYTNIFTSAMPARGICRFCGCTEEHGCKLWGSPLRCAWADMRHTCCTAPKCLEQLEALKPEAERAVSSRVCVCGTLKSTERSFCGPCYITLPWGLQSPLYETRARGFALAYADAKKYLAEQTARLNRGR